MGRMVKIVKSKNRNKKIKEEKKTMNNAVLVEYERRKNKQKSETKISAVRRRAARWQTD